MTQNKDWKMVSGAALDVSFAFIVCGIVICITGTKSRTPEGKPSVCD